MIKRIFDIISASSAIAALSPVFALIATWIKFQGDDDGPIFFKQERVGKNGKLFTLYKFRTMKTNVDPFQQLEEENVLLKGGRLLRNFSLDELPQLFNILKGDMSIVGPRPLYQTHIESMSADHQKRLNVRPGLTGLSQLYYRMDLTCGESLDLEVEYVNTHSFFNDCMIIIKTIPVVTGLNRMKKG